MATRAAFLSFRFGLTDGVSVVARTWMDAFEEFGFEVLTVTGEVTADRTVPGLGLPSNAEIHAGVGTPAVPPTPSETALEIALTEALVDADLVVVENLLTIPMNLAASRAAAKVLAGRPALLHHHDPPWHRDRFAHITELPATNPAWRHVAINRILRDELAERGITASIIYNGFPTPVRRSRTESEQLRREVRRSVGISAEELVVAHPVRAIERKNIPAAIALAEAVGATYWLLGPAEEGYSDELDRLLSSARCKVVHHEWTDVEGIYAAADHIAFPSTWEGFGNPPIEAALYRRSVSVGNYPVAEELRAFGFDWFDPSDERGIAAALASPESEAVIKMLNGNERVASENFSLGRMRNSLHQLLESAEWLP
ncbi:MAG: glycosyltransferase family 4 protein [Actinomycetes bacterium]